VNRDIPVCTHLGIEPVDHPDLAGGLLAANDILIHRHHFRARDAGRGRWHAGNRRDGNGAYPAPEFQARVVRRRRERNTTPRNIVQASAFFVMALLLTTASFWTCLTRWQQNCDRSVTRPPSSLERPDGCEARQPVTGRVDRPGLPAPKSKLSQMLRCTVGGRGVHSETIQRVSDDGSFSGSSHSDVTQQFANQRRVVAPPVRSRQLDWQCAEAKRTLVVTKRRRL
jgi:hypothetical protein